MLIAKKRNEAAIGGILKGTYRIWPHSVCLVNIWSNGELSEDLFARCFEEYREDIETLIPPETSSPFCTVKLKIEAYQ